jgi:hypothetical protein
VTDDTKRLIEASDLTGYVFHTTRKTQIARVEWQHWDLNAPEPEYYPPGGEPENYYLGQPHCEDASYQLGTLWELKGTPFGSVVRTDAGTQWTTPQEPALDVITPDDLEWQIVVVSEAARTFLSAIPNADVRFRPHDVLTIRS